MGHKGWICLDIDGTITADPFSIPQEVINFFTSLHEKGWRFCFVTGRTMSFALKVLFHIPFPYYLSVQNGADLIAMPEKKLLRSAYLSSDIFCELDKIYQDVPDDYIVYSGWQKGDYCYFRPTRCSKEMKDYFAFLMTLSSKPWIPLDDFSSLKEQRFPLIKCLGSFESMQKIEHRLKDVCDVHLTTIKDPTSKSAGYVLLITHKEASKGSALQFLRSIEQNDAIYIAAGDDMNDISLLQQADVAIAMADAPNSLQQIAHIIAGTACENGIINALNQAIHNRNIGE